MPEDQRMVLFPPGQAEIPKNSQCFWGMRNRGSLILSAIPHSPLRLREYRFKWFLCVCAGIQQINMTGNSIQYLFNF